MKTFTQTQKNILHLLQDGQCHSGSALGAALHVSRTAIWKQIKQLIDMGLPLQSVNKQGYRLTQPLILLDEKQIKNQLHDNQFPRDIQLHLFSSVDSTNRFLKDLPPSSKVEVCCAETQTQGRGRFGRHWHSPLAENIYCSSRWQINCDLSRLSGLSLVVSLAIIETLKHFNLDEAIQIKWPNDLLWKNKKLCGSLIEIMAETNGNAMVVIGIGLNVNSNTQAHPLNDSPWCSLYEISKTYQNRNQLIGQLISTLGRYLDEFIQKGFESFQKKWQHHDYLANKSINVSLPTGKITGIAKGINEIGELIVIDEKNHQHELSIGEASLHDSEIK